MILRKKQNCGRKFTFDKTLKNKFEVQENIQNEIEQNRVNC